MADKILEVKNLQMHFPMTKGFFGREYARVKAVDGVSFSITRGETFGLVGESGCGKTTVGKCVLGVHKATGGEILYEGKDIVTATPSEMKAMRRDLQLIFQDPYGSLDPRQSVFTILKDAIVADRQHHSTEEIRRRVNELLYLVELSPEMGPRYPHEMSGGQRQRLGIARALACDPKLIVCDEPVSALDVSIQAQIINLFKRIQRETGITYLFIAHDLAVVRNISHNIAVMYLGKIVEITEAADLYYHPMHPYTQALLSAIPITDYQEERSRQRIVLQGEVPSPIHAPSGCPFNPRCRFATDACRQKMPELTDMGNAHFVACHNLKAAAQQT